MELNEAKKLVAQADLQNASRWREIWTIFAFASAFILFVFLLFSVVFFSRKDWLLLTITTLSAVVEGIGIGWMLKKRKGAIAEEKNALKNVESISKSIKVLSNAERVVKAKELLRKAITYPRGCSEFVCHALGFIKFINDKFDNIEDRVIGKCYEMADPLMETESVEIGVYPYPPKNIQKLTPGDIVGWLTKKNAEGKITTEGHVAIYIGETGQMFIHVGGRNQQARIEQHGFNRQDDPEDKKQKLYKSTRNFG